MCDRDEKRLSRLAESYPWAKAHSSLEDLLAKNEAGARRHRDAGRRPLRAREAGAGGRLPRPLREAAREHDGRGRRALAARRERNKLSIFVDHTFAYTGGVRAIRDMYTRGDLGDLFYIDSVRINLGLFQPDVDVIWDLAPHDISILSYVLGQKVKSVQATGVFAQPARALRRRVPDAPYESGVTAHLHLSWLSPVKVRRMIFSGTKSSVLFDDLEMSEKIKIYDHGVTFDVGDLEARKQVLVNYRRGEMRAPASTTKRRSASR